MKYDLITKISAKFFTFTSQDKNLLNSTSNFYSIHDVN